MSAYLHLHLFVHREKNTRITVQHVAAERTHKAH